MLIGPREPVKITIIVESKTARQTSVFNTATKPYVEIMHPEAFIDDAHKVKLTFHTLSNDENVLFSTFDEELEEKTDGD